jgi:hypothetical protein
MAIGESPQLESFIQEQGTGINNLLASQRAESNALYGKYEAATKAQEPLQAAYTRLGTEAGVPELSKTISGFKTQIAGVQNMINQLNDNITQRTQGTFTNEAQRQRQVAAEQAPLTKQLGEFGLAMTPFTEQMSAAQQSIATQLGLVSADQQKELQPLVMQIDSLSDRFAREMTGYTQSKTLEFNALLAKVQHGWDLEIKEQERANQLADEESAWERTKQQMALQYSYDVKKSNATSTPSTGDVENSLRSEMASYMSQGGNMDPNSGGANFFRALNAKYGGYGISSSRIRQIASDVYKSY